MSIHSDNASCWYVGGFRNELNGGMRSQARKGGYQSEVYYASVV